ncbi:MAG: hypothetical protein CV087_13395 [Candidatus Brocadia sp. WS118]|nr:MAG: hypothetical protein CV087_13395 [Candidatus Brocadia sp. WS118]
MTISEKNNLSIIKITSLGNLPVGRKVKDSTCCFGIKTALNSKINILTGKFFRLKSIYYPEVFIF